MRGAISNDRPYRAPFVLAGILYYSFGVPSLNMTARPKFLTKHVILASGILLFGLEIVGHLLWIVGIIPDNNTGGHILYSFLPMIWLLATFILVIRKLVSRT